MSSSVAPSEGKPASCPASLAAPRTGAPSSISAEPSRRPTLTSSTSRRPAAHPWRASACSSAAARPSATKGTPVRRARVPAASTGRQPRGPPARNSPVAGSTRPAISAAPPRTRRRSLPDSAISSTAAWASASRAGSGRSSGRPAQSRRATTSPRQVAKTTSFWFRVIAMPSTKAPSSARPRRICGRPARRRLPVAGYSVSRRASTSSRTMRDTAALVSRTVSAMTVRDTAPCSAMARSTRCRFWRRKSVVEAEDATGRPIF